MLHSQPTQTVEEPRASRRGRPPDEAKHAAILAAARAIFFAGGPQALTMEAVARAAGVSKVTVYAHFSDLPGLIRGVILAQRARMTQTLEALPTDAATLRQVLIEFGHCLMAYLTSDEFLGLQRLLAAQCARHPWLGPIIHQEGPEATCAKLAALLARAVERGDLRPHDTQAAAEQLLGMWQGFQTLGLMIGGCPKPTPEILRQRIARGVDLILTAHGSAPASARVRDPRGDACA